jgi:hypothetical protein
MSALSSQISGVRAQGSVASGSLLAGVHLATVDQMESSSQVLRFAQHNTTRNVIKSAGCRLSPG